MAGATTISPAGEALIKKWEGFYAKRYRDPVGIWTIGYGTIQNRRLGIKLTAGMTVTKEEATELMRKELRAMEKHVNKLLTRDVSQPQFDAIMSFCYNLGTGAFKKSTLRRAINAGDFVKARAQFGRWVWATDRRTKKRVKLRGLVNRRRDEAKMFAGGAISGVPDARIIPIPRKDIGVQKKPVKETVQDVVKRKDVGLTGLFGVGGLATLAANAEAAISNPWIAFALGAIVTASAIGLFIYWTQERESY